MKLILIISFLTACSFQLLATNLQVGVNKAFKTIAAAVKLAKDGDTVYVDAGMYMEKNLVIDKRIVLKGMGYPVLDGEKKYEVISIKAEFILTVIRITCIPGIRHQM